MGLNGDAPGIPMASALASQYGGARCCIKPLAVDIGFFALVSPMLSHCITRKNVSVCSGMP